MTGNHAPDSLKYQWRLLGLVMRSEWATSLDKAVAYEIIDNYYSKFGNSRASLRYLQEATGAQRPNVIASTRRLVENGPFSIIRKGKGTRPTEYKLHFEMVSENRSGIAGDTANDNEPSGIAGNTSCGIAGDTTNCSSGIADNTETVLHVTVLQDGLQDRMIECTAPTAPPAVGLLATAAVTAQGGFEELWKTYFPLKGQGSKAAARDVYEKLALSPEAHDFIVAAARDWHAAWAAQEDAAKPRRHLNVWLREENYECDPPTAYKPKERKARPERICKAVVEDNDNIEPEADSTWWPEGEYEGEFIANEVVHEYDGKDVAAILTFQINTPGEHVGKTFTHKFYSQCWMKSVQDEGNRYLTEICHATGMASIVDLDDIMYRSIRAVTDGRRVVKYLKPEAA